MPPFRRSVDLDEACRFLQHATASTPPTGRDPNRLQAPPPVEHTGRDMFTVRKTTACPECGAQPGDRCHDPGGFTMAFLHEARLEDARSS